MKINLIFNKYIPDYKKALEIVEKSLISHNADFRTFDLEKMEEYGDITFVIGGDGTLLRAARFYSKSKIAVLGINVGRLGFLAQAGVDEIDSVIEAVQEGHYCTEDRIMLNSGEYTALNDFVIKGCNPSRTSKFFLEIDICAVQRHIGHMLLFPIRAHGETYTMQIYTFLSIVLQCKNTKK